MIRSAFLIVACCALGLAIAQTDENETAALHRLPKPLDAVAYDLGDLEKQFQVVECRLYPADEFTVGGRVVAEETIVWSLEAKEGLKGAEVYDLLQPSPVPSPFLKVRFFKTVDGKEVPADARPKGYSLIGDRRWISRKTGPDLAKGEKLQVWFHLGNEGSAGLIALKATKMVVAMK
jgi:hypothetical protein